MTVLLLAAALAAASAAYIVYPVGEPPAYEVASPVTGGLGEAPLRGLAEAVSKSAYSLGEAMVEGAPRVALRHGHMALVEVGGYIVMPAPGWWLVEGKGESSHMQVILLLARAEWVAADGRPAEVYMPGLGRATVLVAYELEVVVGGEEYRLIHQGWGPGPGEWGPGHGGPHPGMPGMPWRGGDWWQEP